MGRDTRTIERPAAAPDLVIDLRDPPPETPLHRRTGVVALVALNVLNVSDAVLTYFVTRAGIAVEGNPVVEWMTLPGKVAFVAVASLVLWKLRPRALAIPLVAYSAVVCYTIGGALLSG